jgi:hypothetical protein
MHVPSYTDFIGDTLAFTDDNQHLPTHTGFHRRTPVFTDAHRLSCSTYFINHKCTFSLKVGFGIKFPIKYVHINNIAYNFKSQFNLAGELITTVKSTAVFFPLYVYAYVTMFLKKYWLHVFNFDLRTILRAC